MGWLNLNVKPKLQGRQHLDEKHVPMKGKKDHYDLNCIDSVTKYVTAHLFVEKRTLQKCVQFLNQIKASCYDQILQRYRQEQQKPAAKRKLITFVCDGFTNYRAAWSKLLWRVSELVFGVPIACRKYGLEHNNNAIERYNGKIKDRIKVMRGGFNSVKGAEAFLDMRRIVHNFVNPHQGLEGRTPAEAAEINLPLSRNRLLALIKYVARSRITKR